MEPSSLTHFQNKGSKTSHENSLLFNCTVTVWTHSISLSLVCFTVAFTLRIHFLRLSSVVQTVTEHFCFCGSIKLVSGQ